MPASAATTRPPNRRSLYDCVKRSRSRRSARASRSACGRPRNARSASKLHPRPHARGGAGRGHGTCCAAWLPGVRAHSWRQKAALRGLRSERGDAQEAPATPRRARLCAEQARHACAQAHQAGSRSTRRKPASERTPACPGVRGVAQRAARLHGARRADARRLEARGALCVPCIEAPQGGQRAGLLVLQHVLARDLRRLAHLPGRARRSSAPVCPRPQVPGVLGGGGRPTLLRQARR